MSIKKLITTIFFLALFIFLFSIPSTDPDLGWQMRCGKEIWQGKGICSLNKFSVLLDSYAWVNHHWLYQVIIFFIFKNSGFVGLSFFNAFIITLSFLFFYLSIKNYNLEKMLSIGLILFLTWGIFSFGIRSQLLGFLFFNLFLFIFSSKSSRLLILLPLFMLFWVNMHASFILGLILLIIFYLKEIIFSKNFILPTFVLSASIITTFLNPFGFKIYGEIWRHYRGIDLAKLIAEWVPPSPFVWWLVLVSAFGFFLTFNFLKKSKRENLFLSFLILPFAFLALKARRHVPFYFFVFFYSLFNLTFAETFFKPYLKKQKLIRSDLKLFLSIGFLFISLFIYFPKIIKANSFFEKEFCKVSFIDYPCRAVKFLKKQEEKGNIFNRYEWGGFLIWTLPEYKIFVDGRMPAWQTPSGKSPYTIYLETLQVKPNWQETLNRFNINWILISPGTFMDILLSPDAQKFGWKEVYRDKISVIYKKKDLIN